MSAQIIRRKSAARRQQEQNLQERTQSTGGLHLGFKNVGEQIVVDHAGERLTITYQGGAGDSKAKLTFSGPRSFGVWRAHLDPK